jgi:hypothetical protein
MVNRRFWLVPVLAFGVACDRDDASNPPEEATSMPASEPTAPAEGSDPGPAEEEEADPIDTSFRVEGGLSKEQVQAVIEKQHTPIRECFDKSLERIDQVDTSGAIVVRWVIGVKGDVAEAEVEATRFGDPATEACIVDEVETWTFPAPKGKSATIHHAFYLRSY